MRKSEVYSWRMSPEMKAALEDAARDAGQPLAGLLDRIAAEWLEARHSDAGAGEREARERALAVIGCLDGEDPRRAERARALVRRRLATRRARP